jgi:hypothetical protein
MVDIINRFNYLHKDEITDGEDIKLNTKTIIEIAMDIAEFNLSEEQINILDLETKIKIIKN